jgi:hypothetical protein
MANDRNGDSPVTAEEATELALEILKRTKDMAARPYALMAALKSAAASVENAVASNLMKTAIATTVSNVINAGRR